MGRILIIDDDEQFRKLLQAMLEADGHETQAAADGEAALRLLKKSQPDLIITDLIMPGREGLEVIMEVRQLYPDIKIIATSGGGRVGPDNYLAVARKLGAKRTLAKPFHREELIEAVREVLAE